MFWIITILIALFLIIIIALIWYYIINAFIKKNNFYMLNFYSFFVDKELKRIRIADEKSNNKFQNKFQLQKNALNQWLTFRDFAALFSTEDQKTVMELLESNQNTKIHVKLAAQNNKKDKFVDLILELYLDGNSFLILKNIPGEKHISRTYLEKVPSLDAKTKFSIFKNAKMYVYLLDENVNAEFLISKMKLEMKYVFKWINGYFKYKKFLILVLEKDNKNIDLEPILINKCTTAIAKLATYFEKDQKKYFLSSLHTQIELSIFKTINNLESNPNFLHFTMEEIYLFKSNLELILNKENSRIIKRNVTRNGKDKSKLFYLENQTTSKYIKIKSLDALPEYSKELNLNYLEKIVNSTKINKIVDLIFDNFSFIMLNREFFSPNDTVLNLKYSQNNLKLIEMYGNEFNFGVELAYIDEQIINTISILNIKYIFVNETISKKIKDDYTILLSLIYLNQVCIKSNITLIYFNPQEEIELKYKKKIGSLNFIQRSEN
ncbi:hypothetical protein NV226_03035 [Mycoplasma iguanae]|uniref:Uncharacterized protein n=1 Tax=Mycoplasma iguanae TaxID=292461 RepID=A0ABY5R897_9MOLU|nr:hypothetical protein [Mycoplasma iguanae]UVD81674.1 hypothetical protein NV226_03035 [Mycoplasma iguanae]